MRGCEDARTAGRSIPYIVPDLVSREQYITHYQILEPGVSLAVEAFDPSSTVATWSLASPSHGLHTCSVIEAATLIHLERQKQMQCLDFTRLHFET